MTKTLFKKTSALAQIAVVASTFTMINSQSFNSADSVQDIHFARPWEAYTCNPYYEVIHGSIDKSTWPARAMTMFPNIRDFSQEEARQYEQALENLFKPTGKNFFD